MSILTSASSTSVSRGYGYYLDGAVLSCVRIGEDEYEGYVRGSSKEPYHVILNIKHPRKSSCDCPHAQGSNVVCKHIVAMYFYLFPEEASEYKDWMESDYFDDEYYEDEYDEYNEYDEYDDSRYEYFNKVTLPYCYDELLDEYVNSFSIKELKQFMKDKLNKDREYTFNYYLKDRYENYVKKHGDNISKIDALNSKLIKLSQIRDYDYYNFNEKILTTKEKQFITERYDSNKQLFNRTLLNPSLAVFLDYVWVIKFIKDKVDKKIKDEYTKELENLFNSLKNYGIRNTMPKSNVLICLYELNDYGMQELAVSLVKNVKYIDYVRYVIDRVNDPNDLYENIKKQIKNNVGFNKHEIPNIFLEFHDRFQHDINGLSKILLDHSYYDFIYNDNYESLAYIYRVNNKEYIDMIKQNVHKKEKILAVYCIEEDYDKLYQALKQENKDYLYDRYLEYIAINYSDELYERYRGKILETLEEGMGRDIYSKAVGNISRINKLENGAERVKELIDELKNSKHAKKPALFDEINKEIKRLRIKL